MDLKNTGVLHITAAAFRLVTIFGKFCFKIVKGKVLHTIYQIFKIPLIKNPKHC